MKIGRDVIAHRNAEKLYLGIAFGMQGELMSKARLDRPAKFKDEVLAHLLALNAERALSEQAVGLSVAGKDDGAFDDEEERD